MLKMPFQSFSIQMILEISISMPIELVNMLLDLFEVSSSNNPHGTHDS